ncbi:MAG: DAK2 domain-containing protein, partial [Stackebrandtia sp.]
MHEVDGPDDSVTPGALPGLTAAAIRRWFDTSAVALARHRRTIDSLNVFPVPDGDTGTNLAATVAVARDVLNDTAADAGLPELIHRAAKGALLGARGNSGVILAQLLAGLADSWDDDTVDANGLADGLRRAADTAADAVAAPA